MASGISSLIIGSVPLWMTTMEALRPGGVMAVNFMAEEKKLDTYLQRIEKSFDSHVACLNAAARVNIIAFAFKRQPRQIAWAELQKRARQLKKIHDLPFEDFIAGLKKLNSHMAAVLRLRSIAVD